MGGLLNGIKAWADGASHTVADLASDASGVVTRLADGAVETLKDAKDLASGGVNTAVRVVTSTAGDVKDAAASGVNTAVEYVSGTTVGKMAGEALDSVKSEVQNVMAITTSLAKVHEDVADPPKVVERFLASIPAVRRFLDAKADAIAIGYLGEGGAGLVGAIGAEILYVREQGDRPARLRVSRVTGQLARLNIGAATRAYFRCLYGDADAIASATERKGGEVGAGVLISASVGFFKSEIPGSAKPVRGWMGSLGAGGGFGIPLLSDSALYQLKENPIASIVLTKEQAKSIEEAIAQGAPDRSWLRGVATSL